MTMQEKHLDEWLDRAFRLAFFLHGDRRTARAIVTSAMNKLETASNAQFKRLYYTPTGRSDAARATRSRVSLNDLQLLQRLVFVESEAFERENESKMNEKNLLIYFVKHLVRIALKRNSFYVTLGISRILHNYGTADAMEIYNVVVQDPERVHDDYYYRSRKGVLMKELKARFGDLLEIVRANRGEERFQTAPETVESIETIKESLEIFTPWNSRCALPEKFDPFDDVIAPFYFDKDDPDGEHRIEINRIHATLHPDCFKRLTEALRLPASKEKMEIPKFMLTETEANFDDEDRRNPPGLEADELQAIKDSLAAHAESRRAMSAGFLRVVVDGARQARIDLNETSTVNFDLDESAELIEVRAADDSGETILAAHLLNFEALEKGSQNESILLEGGQKISFSFTPTKDAYGEIIGLRCAVEYAETAVLKRFALALRRAKFAAANLANQPQRILKPALTFGLIIAALTFGWLIFRNADEKKDNFAVAPIPQNQNSQEVVSQNTPNEENTNINKPDAPKNSRETNQFASEQTAPKQKEKPANRNLKREDKPMLAPKKEILIQPPPREQLATNKAPRKDETDDDGTLRLPMREDKRNFPNEKIVTRGSAKTNGKSLAEIKSIYLEITGDKILGEQIAASVAADIGKSGAFAVTNDRENADAALKIYVRHESDADTREDASVAAIVRLVNAKGFVVYPTRRRVSGWKYVGTMQKLPPRIARDLTAAKVNIKK